MLSPKPQSGNYFFSPRTVKQIKQVRSPSFMKTEASLELSRTEEQQDRIKKIIDDVRKGGPMSPNVSMITHSELNRMKSSAITLTVEDLIQQKKIIAEQAEKQMGAARARKKKMLDIEAERRKAIPISQGELEKRAENERLLERATTLINEDKDDVKHMNQMIHYAKMVSIRDRQVQEKINIKDQSRIEERKKDLLMEVERLKSIKFYEELDKSKMEEQKRSALETVKQIEERKIERRKLQDEVEREGQEMLRTMKERQIEEANNALVRKRQRKIILDQIYEANQNAIANKQERYRRELEEEDRIANYLRERTEKEAAQQAEAKNMKDEKEREIQRLRELQEKNSDRHAEIDGLRARRATEEFDRQARLKERKEAELKAKITRELLEARHQQSMEKQQMLEDQAKNERDEFARIIETQKMMADEELRVEVEKKQKIQQHSLQLKKQIAINEEKKRQAKREELEYGKQIKDKINGEKSLLENIKVQKLEKMLGLDIPVKYAAELARKKIIF